MLKMYDVLRAYAGIRKQTFGNGTKVPLKIRFQRFFVIVPNF